MADNTSKHPKNAPGSWYIDTNCTPTRLCLQVPGSDALLTEGEDGLVYFHKQPETEDELRIANDCMGVCGPCAIGNDGA